MKKLYIIIGAVILIWAIILGSMTLLKNNENKLLIKVKNQVQNYLDYKPNSKEYHRVTRSAKNDLYYYASDGKRYVFPTIEVYRTWYGNFMTDNLKVESLEKLYKTPLGGSVTFRPGTLMQTPTDPKIYLVIKNGLIRPFSDEKLLEQIYGSDWHKAVINIENYYFTSYKVAESIQSLADFPEIPKEINIDQDKGFK